MCTQSIDNKQWFWRYRFSMNQPFLLSRSSLARVPVSFLFSLFHPAASLIHINSPPSVHLGQWFLQLLLITISGEKCSQSASKCSNCGLRQTCSSGVDVCWAGSTQALRATHHSNSESVFPRTAGNTLTGSPCFFINIVSILSLRRRDGKDFPRTESLIPFPASCAHHETCRPYPCPHACPMLKTVPSGVTFFLLELDANYKSVSSLWHSTSCILVIGVLFSLFFNETFVCDL